MEAERRAASIRRRSPVKGSNRPHLYPFAVDYTNSPPPLIYRVPEKKHHRVRIATPSSEASSEIGWPPSRLAGRVFDGTTNALRSYWQQNVARDERMRTKESLQQDVALRARPKPYGFPRWRSTDALSASLVASNPVEIPRDSRIPEQRLAKMKETEKEAVNMRAQIQQQAEPAKKLTKGKSLDSLVFIPDQPTWYNRDKIRESVSRESIANITQAKQRFESGNGMPPPPPERSSSTSAVPPPLPPKSEEVQILQRMHKEDSYDREYNSPSVASYGTAPYSGIEWGGVNGFVPNQRESNFNYEQQLLLLFLRQNPSLADSLGIHIPESVRSQMDEIAWRRVELKVMEDEQNSYTPQSYSPSQGKAGRYVKKPQHHHYHMGMNGTPARFKKGPGESLIAAEIRAAKEREEELRRSRSELGLPTLEDTMDMWRSGQRINISVNGMRSAVSYDQLHHDQNSISDLQKTSSIGELNRADNYYEREDRSQRDQRAAVAQNYKLQNTEDQDVMYYGPSSRRLGTPGRYH